MKRGGTWLIVVALAALGAVAAADALRERAETRPTPVETEPPSPGVPLTVPGLHGTLYYTAAETCELRALDLPELSPLAPPDGPGECRFSLSPSGRHVRSEGTVWDRHDDWASEVDGTIAVVASDGRSLGFLGSAPSFTTDGVLTFAFDGAVHALDLTCPRTSESAEYVERPEIARCSRIVLNAAHVRRAARRHPNAPERPGILRRVRIKETAWLGRRRLVALLALDIRFVGRFDMVALFDGSRILTTVAGQSGNLLRLRVSPRGGYFAVLTGGGSGVTVFDRSGAVLATPRLTAPRAVAWSPGETWTAIATPASVYFFRTRAVRPLARRVAIAAADIAWRSR